MNFDILHSLEIRDFILVLPFLIILTSVTLISSIEISNIKAQNSTNEVLELTFKTDLLSTSGNYTGAIRMYDKVLEINPNDTFALFNKGLSYSNLGNYTGAVESYDKALAIDPNDIYVYLFRGYALDDLGNYTGAVESYDKALAIDPNYLSALRSKSLSLYNLGNYSRAIQIYDKVLEINPYDTVAITNKDAALNTVNLMSNTVNQQKTDNIASFTIGSKPAELQIGSYLIRDPETNVFFGDGYRVDPHVGLYIIFNNNESNTGVYQLASSAQNLVQVSDSKIGFDIKFKMPVSDKGTLERIERINGLYDVRYIDTQPSYTNYIAFEDSPLTINNTNYANFTIQIKKFNNQTGYLFIDGSRA